MEPKQSQTRRDRAVALIRAGLELLRDPSPDEPITVRRELELLKSLPPADEEGIRAALLAIKEQMDELAANSPSIPSAFKARIDAHLKSQSHDRIYQLGPPGPGTPG